MSDLVEWLTAQIDEDERVARDAGGRNWGREEYGCVVDAADNGPIVYSEGTPSREQADHIARHDPARVLRQVEATRKILDRYADCVSRFDDYDHSSTLAAEQMREYEDFVLPALALPYADRPGYRSEWAP